MIVKLDVMSDPPDGVGILPMRWIELKYARDGEGRRGYGEMGFGVMWIFRLFVFFEGFFWVLGGGGVVVDWLGLDGNNSLGGWALGVEVLKYSLGKLNFGDAARMLAGGLFGLGSGDVTVLRFLMMVAIPESPGSVLAKSWLRISMSLILGLLACLPLSEKASFGPTTVLVLALPFLTVPPESLADFFLLALSNMLSLRKMKLLPKLLT